MFQYLIQAPRRLAIFFIKLYQKTISPDHGPLRRFFPFGYCKFQPTCSDYMIESLKKYGFLWGSFRGFYRILKCNPCSKGGIDRA